MENGMKQVTNKEYIQSMSTEELAFLLSYFSTCDHCVYTSRDCMSYIRKKEPICEKGIALWLEQERKAQK